MVLQVAQTSEQQAYPKIYPTNWWKLRNALHRKVQKVRVDEVYLSSVLGVDKKAARNVRPQLVAIRLIDEEGVLTDRALDWRDDGKYADVCQAIVEEVYPEGLQAACPPPDPDPNELRNWFMRHAGVGEGAARMMARFYQLLCRRDPSEGRPEAADGPKTTRSAASKRRTATPPSGPTPPAGGTAVPVVQPAAPSVAAGGASSPTVNIAVQVYITPDASADQIDQVFASMARHIYRLGAQGDEH